MVEREQALEALLKEDRRFPPDQAFRERANAADPDLYTRAAADPEAFWAEWARRLEWFEPWREVLQWQPPHAQWFTGGRLNACSNCLDRHLGGWRRNKAALVWEGEPGDSRTYTYWDLHREVSKFANVLKSLGVKKGDRVAIYLPMVPEAAIAMLACARIGAPHSVVFGGFSSDSLRDRINDAEAKLLITADGGYRRGRVVALKEAADRALAETPCVENVVVVRRGAGLHAPTHMKDGRDHWYDDLMSNAATQCDAEPVDAEDLLFILYTSGTTGKPKGVVHTTGGYMTQVTATTNLVFDLREDDVYWCTADVGWVTGHSYIVYGPLSNGATVVMYEGAPDWPDRGRFWELIQKYGITILYTAPTAIRAFMRWGTEWPARYDLGTLRLLGSVGEPINPEAWMWYREHIGGGRCPIVDTWWQTETGGIMITPLPGMTETKPGSATIPFPGISAAVLTAEGDTAGAGYLAITKPWPGMLRTIWNDDERFQQTYWARWDGIYFPGDGAKRDEDGYYWILGRVDDVLNVAGHRIGTMEVESALVDHPSVAEAAVVGRADEVKGQAIAAFVTVKEGVPITEQLKKDLREHVSNKIGAIARPDDILFAADLPKTRSGKIMRRLLRDIAEGRALGDTTTLADPAVVAKLKTEYEDKEG
ncbi:acetate--CoA ligase [soil metagenome]